MNTAHLQSMFGSALPGGAQPEPRRIKEKSGRERLLDAHIKVRMHQEMLAFVKDQGGVQYMRRLVERDMQQRGK